MDERVRPVGLATAAPAPRIPAERRAVLEAQGVYKIFVPRGGSRTRAMTALRDVSLDVRPGEFLTLIAGSVASREIARLSAGVSLKYFSPRMRSASALLAGIHAVAFRSARA